MNKRQALNEIRASIVLAITDAKKDRDALKNLKLRRMVINETGRIDGLETALRFIDEHIKRTPVNIRKDTQWGEYIIPDPDGNPEHAYRCTDKEEAIDQAHHMYPGRVIKLNGREV